ncbi:hypothetical protein CK203_116344 [Vitis vinifera]|uniref:Uncharacterized protein n=1 Tax=Vitis vinifera TaxID=29760 RepID=A0A438C9C3_VITVI|nr:hypothetical protein CK203_116344 [Vitis vinifera]
MSPFTYEDDFTHYTQNEDHGSRRASLGIKAIGKSYRRREQMMTPFNEELFSVGFEFMSIGTQFSDSSNEVNVYLPYVMDYGQPFSKLCNRCKGRFDTSTWVNPEYPIHVKTMGKTQEIYVWHVRIFNQYYQDSMSWYQYCLQQEGKILSSTNSIEPHRSSFWF